MSGRLSVNMFVVLAVLLVTAAALPARAVIQIYGRDSCSNCQSLRQSLDSYHISYIFYDVDRDIAKNREMWAKIWSITPDSHRIMLPVVDVNGKVLINHPTSYDQLKPYPNEPNAEKKSVDPGSDYSPGPTILDVYGRDICSNCQALMKSLQEHGISYIFFNVDKNSSWNDEMWKKVHSVDPSLKTFTFPVVDINGKVLINNPTSYEQIKQYLNNPKSTPNPVCSAVSCKVSEGSDFTAYQRDVLTEINLARTNPSGYARIRLAKEGESGEDNGAINELKHHARMYPLRLNAMLCRAASMYAMYLAEHNVFGHNENGTPFTRIRESGYSFHAAGENIAAYSFNAQDASVSPQQAAIAFVKQLIIDKGIEGNGHRENILNADFKELGVGFFHKTDSKYVNYTVQDFGAH